MSLGHIRNTEGAIQYILESEPVSIISRRKLFEFMSMDHKYGSSKKSRLEETLLCLGSHVEVDKNMR